MKFGGIFPNNVTGILNIETLPEYATNVTWIFFGKSKNTIVVFSSG